MASSCCSYSSLNDQSIDNTSGNKIVKDKFDKLYNNIDESYVDDIYPPNKYSVCLNNSDMKIAIENLEKEGKSIEWVRLSDLYPTKKLVVWNRETENKCKITKGVINSERFDGDYLPCAFNVIKNNNYLL
eukprot:GHVR01154032.1.p1 GENE.GHVR01154032.1~~GHVR01154032.1.p1  ORF type:complete len:130 (-),score=9.86 GHVR01154032.1:915-1304(-)